MQESCVFQKFLNILKGTSLHIPVQDIFHSFDRTPLHVFWPKQVLSTRILHGSHCYQIPNYNPSAAALKCQWAYLSTKRTRNQNVIIDIRICNAEKCRSLDKLRLSDMLTWPLRKQVKVFLYINSFFSIIPANLKNVVCSNPPITRNMLMLMLTPKLQEEYLSRWQIYP